MTSRRMIRLPLIALSLAAIATGCDDDTDSPYAPEAVDRAVLVHFQSCDDLLDYAQYRALDEVGPYGFEGEYGWDEAGGEDGAVGESGGDDGGGEPAPNDGSDGGGGTPDYSGTNVQEVGVDEPDIVKTDGNRILALAQGSLHYVDVKGEAPALVGSIPVLQADSEYYGYEASEMLVHGNRVLLSVSRGAWDLPVAIREAFGLSEEDYMPVVQLTEIDVSDPANMRVVGSLYVEGGYLSGRLHDHTARVVLSSQVHTLQFKYPWDFLDESDIVLDEFSGGYDELAYAKAEAEAEAYNRRIVIDTEIESWVPSYVFEREGSELRHGQLVDCERMMRPGTHAGLGTLSVLTIDLAQSLGLGDAVGLFSEGQTVYASPESLYVATRPFLEEEQQGPARTDDAELSYDSYVHKFDITQEDAAHYVASGSVPGYLLSQWSMSEHAGDLRVATTDWGWGDGSESYVSVLREKGQRLELVGQVAGLGKGEQIYAVRFIADVGYVVTFRQTDPLYTIDLANPEAPAMVGELKINGYSAYLHPVGEGLLLGVGQDGTDDGQLLGTQVSLFDVSDPANPTVLSQRALGEWGSSEVEFDHHAFLYWGPEQLAVFPVQTWGWDEETGEDLSFSGAVAYRIDATEGIELVGTIEHDQATLDEESWYGNNIRRSMVIGDQLFTMSNEGLQRSALADLAGSGWTEF
jgi:hypothetical protein